VKYTKRVAFLLFIIAFVVMSESVNYIGIVRSMPKMWIVDDDGEADFHTIQEAINAAASGDTVYVKEGTYYERVVVDKRDLTLVGDGWVRTVIDGGGVGTVIKVTADNVVISGFTIQNGGSRPGLEVLGYADVTDNRVTKNKIGIHVCSECRIAENVVTGNGQGILLYFSSEVRVEANNLTGNTVGISLHGSSNNVIKGNRVTESVPGGHGVTLLSGSSNNTVVGNFIVNNSHGMWFSGSYNNLVLENTIANNGILGIELTDSSNNILYHNNFINNKKHVTINKPNIWDGGYPTGGNYWSDYRDRYPNVWDEYQGEGQDVPGSDLIWDSPYVIDKDNRDRYPFVTPYGELFDFTAPITTDDYDGLWHNKDFVVTLTAFDDLSGVAETCYRINNGTLKRVQVDGHPLVNTEGTNNTIEYWSIDWAGNEERHHVLVGVKLDKTKPVANAGQDVTVRLGSIISFDASDSSDSLSGIVSYEWDFGDGTKGTGVSPSHNYTEPGNYIVTLTVRDAAGNSGSDSIIVKVLSASPQDRSIWLIGPIPAILILVIFTALFIKRRKARRYRRRKRK